MQDTETTRTLDPRPHSPDRPAQSPAVSRRAGRRRTNILIIVMSLMVAAFLIYETPPYFALNPKDARRPLGPAIHYWLIVGHITFGTLAMVTLLLQLWPWLRNNHPAFHRWSGRVYVFGGALPTSIFAISMWRLIPDPGSVGVVMSATLWSAMALVGWWHGRQGNFAAHRRFMLYSFAVVWGLVIWGFIIAEVGLHTLPVTDFGRLIEAARWVGWVADLIVVQWWLDRTRGRDIELPSRAVSQKQPAGT